MAAFLLFFNALGLALVIYWLSSFLNIHGGVGSMSPSLYAVNLTPRVDANRLAIQSLVSSIRDVNHWAL